MSSWSRKLRGTRFSRPAWGENGWVQKNWRRERNRNPTLSVGRGTGRWKRMQESYVEGLAAPETFDFWALRISARGRRTERGVVPLSRSLRGNGDLTNDWRGHDRQRDQKAGVRRPSKPRSKVGWVNPPVGWPGTDPRPCARRAQRQLRYRRDSGGKRRS